MAKILNKHSCPTCGTALNEREVLLYDGMVQSLSRVYDWAVENKRWQMIKSREIRHLFGPNEIDRFRDWRYFTPLMVGGDHGYYDFDCILINHFLSGRTKVPTRILKNPLTKAIKYYDYRFVHEISPLTKLLQNDEYQVQYGKTSEEDVIHHSPSKSVLSAFQTLKKGFNGEITCTCEGYKYRKSCRHLVEYNQKLTASLF